MRFVYYSRVTLPRGFVFAQTNSLSSNLRFATDVKEFIQLERFNGYDDRYRVFCSRTDLFS